MTVVRNEYERGENDPAEALDEEMWAAAFWRIPIITRPSAGAATSRKCRSKSCASFYDTFYWPNNATVTVIGDFDPAAALDLVKKYYGATRARRQPIPAVYTEEPPQSGARRVMVSGPANWGR